jgi:hypothetical protein
VAQLGRLRIYINVAQSNAPGVNVGGTRQFIGRLTLAAGALDPTTETLVTEVQVANPEGTLRPGMFVNVNLQNRRLNPPTLVPGDAPIVETVDRAIHLQSISIGPDHGAVTEVLSGPSPDDIVIVNPNDEVHKGANVQAALTQANLDVGSGGPQQSKMNSNSEKLQPQPGAEAQPTQPSQADKEARAGILIRNTDRDFLLAMGVEPYEPDRLFDELRSRARDRMIQAIAVLQLVALVGALAWTSM